MLKGFRITGYAFLSKEDFFELLDIPKSYWKKSGDIDRYVIKSIKEELTPLFRGLAIRKKALLLLLVQQEILLQTVKVVLAVKHKLLALLINNQVVPLNQQLELLLLDHKVLG